MQNIYSISRVFAERRPIVSALFSTLILMVGASTVWGQPKPQLKLAGEAAQVSDAELGERRALDPVDPFDSRIRQEISNLDWGYNLAYPGTPATPVWWSKRGYTLAHRTYGLVLNRDELKNYVERLSNKYGGGYAESIIYLAALAHERAHIAQFRYYKEQEYDRHPPKVVETQADIIAGTWIGGKVFNPGTFSQVTTQGQAALQAEAKRYFECADETMKELGKTDSHDHGNPFQRSKAIETGTNLSLYAFLKSLPSIAGGLETVRQQNAAATDLHPGEKMMEWSLRKAYRLCGLPFPKPEQTGPTPLASALALLITARPAFADVRGAKDTSASTEEENWYAALLPIPGAQETALCIDRTNVHNSFATARLYTGTQVDQAQRVFAEWNKKVGATLPEGYVRTESRQGSHRPTLVAQFLWTSPDHRTVRLRLSQAKTSSQYSVDIWVDEA